MKTTSSAGMSFFWNALEEIRGHLEHDSDAGEPVQQRLHDLEAKLPSLPANIAARRREVLAGFAQTYGLEIPAATIRFDNQSLDGFVRHRTPGVSLVTCCKNRNENLLHALPSWLAHSEISEIIIVDWDSDQPIAKDVSEAGFTDPRIRVARVENEPRWILSFAFNVGFRLARFDRVLKADADIVLSPRFFRDNPLRPHSFIAGNWRRAREGQAFVNGFFYLHHQALIDVNGFNEHITTYGWDDDELYARLEESGLARLDVHDDSIDHLDHDDTERLDDGPIARGDQDRANGWADLAALPMHKIRTNRFISTIMPGWDSHRILLPFVIKGQVDNQLFLRREGWVPHPVPDHVRNTATRLAAQELVSWRTGIEAWQLPPEALDLLLSNRRLGDVAPLHVALALAGAPAEALLGPHAVVSLDNSVIPLLDQLNTRIRASGRVLVVRGWKMPEGGLPPESILIPPEPRGPDLPQVDTLTALDTDERPILQLTSEALRSLQSPHIVARRDRLFIDAQHGLGNRLRALGSAGAIARATGRELVVVWEPDHHCEGRLSDLFNYDGAVIEESFLNDARKRGDTVLNYMEIEDDAVKGAPLALQGGRDAYARSAYVLMHPDSHWDSENAFLRELVPAEPVRRLIASVPEHRDIGLHIRMEGAPGTDTNSYDRRENWTAEGHAEIHHWRSASHYSNFLRRLDPLLAEQPQLKLFLAADLPETYEAMRSVLGNRVTMLERGLYDRSTEQLHYALADMLCLARCQRFFGSHWSSFSELAIRLSGDIIAHEMSGVDF